jgi:hypothetical protein
LIVRGDGAIPPTALREPMSRIRVSSAESTSTIPATSLGYSSGVELHVGALERVANEHVRAVLAGVLQQGV